MTYDANADSATSTFIARDPSSFKWLISRKLSATSFSYESVRYSSGSANNRTVVKYASTVSLNVKAWSKDLTCMVLSDVTSAGKKLNIVDLSSLDNTVKEEIIATNLVTAATADGSNYEVATNCAALKINTTVYHYDFAATSASKFLPYTLPTVTDPVMSSDLKYLAANDGIYRYSTANKNYTQVKKVSLN